MPVEPPKDTTTTRVGRTVRLTPKMEAFMNQAFKGNAAKQRKELLDMTCSVEQLTRLEQPPTQEIQDKYQDIVVEQTKLFDLEEEESHELEPDEKAIYQDFFLHDDTIIQTSSMVIKAFIDQTDVKPEDSASQVGSRVSRTAPARSEEQIKIILEERTKVAVLENQRKKLIQQAELDRERVRLEELRKQLEQKEKLQEVERELELSKTKLEILAQLDDPEGSHVSSSSKRSRGSKVDHHEPKKRKAQHVRTSSPELEYVPPKFDCTQVPRRITDSYAKQATGTAAMEDVFGRLADAIDRGARRTVQIEPQVFNGDVLTYSLWKRSFEELVEKDVTIERRFIYLLRYTSGSARECIENLTHLDNAEAYIEGMKLLNERFGDKFLSYEAIRERLDAWPRVADGDGIALRKYADFLCTCLSAMNTNASLKTLDTMPENHKIISKLPRRLIDKWSNRVDEWQYGSSRKEDTHEYPPFSVFVEFIKKQARIELGPVKRMMYRSDTLKNKPIRVHMTDVDETEETGELACYSTTATGLKCLCCTGNHELGSCHKFEKMTVKERMQFSYSQQLCRGCLKTGHYAWNCKDMQRCTTCQGRHHQLFHDDTFKPKARQPRETNHTEQQGDKVQKTVLSTHIDDDNVTAHIVPGFVRNARADGQPVKVYIVIDTQSNACFVSQEISDKVAAVGKRTRVELHTMAGVEDVLLDKVEGLQVMDRKQKVNIELPATYVKNGMDTSHDQIPTPKEVARWDHLSKIARSMEEVDRSIPIGMLIGRNCYQATKLTDFIPSQGSDPYAVCTSLGWGIVGKMQKVDKKEKSTVWVHTTTAHEPSPAKFFDDCSADFRDQHAEGVLSQDDLKFMRLLNDGLIITDKGNLMLPLPMKSRDNIPDNAAQAIGTLKSLKRKFDKNPSYKEKFVKKMEELFVKGFAEKAPEEKEAGKVWYLTFHGVFHPKKVDELRVVFNGKRKYLGVILNELLLQGPDQMNNLVGVFCRFRKEKVTLTCDIEAMFYQVLVTPDDRNYLRFFWWPDGDTSVEPEECRMMVHVFGATSSPGVAHYALDKVAEMFEEKYGKEAADFIRDSFYVDDGVTAVPSDEEAISLMKASRALCGEGGFNLTKFSSNSKAVVEQIPEEIRAKNLKELNLTRDVLPQGYTLGIFLCNEEDCIRFQVKLTPMPKTRRGILSTTSQVYDPLGLVSPFLLEGKRILQKLCKDGLDWDEEIPEELLKQWNEWIGQIMELEELRFARCYSTRGVAAATTVELHHFADASLSGYGQCSYIRLCYEDGMVESSLVMSKAKVLPKQTVTVPRLELAAAVLSVRMARFLQEQMKLEDVTHHYWTDSKVVMGYIGNDSKRFHVYVANRVANIREFSDPEQWHHVETHLNPADLASRGTTVAELKDNSLWMHGPEFLRDSGALWREEKVELEDDDPEIRKVAALATDVQEEKVDWIEKFKKFSTWKSLSRAIAKIKQLADNQKEEKRLDTVTLDERKQSEIFIINKVQERHFKEELAALKVLKEQPNRDAPKILKTGRLRKLDPFVDDEGIIRVGGRFKKGPWSYGLKHPIILPTEDHVSGLLIEYMHVQIAHCGREATMSALRASGYWVLSVRRKIDSMIWKCVKCRRFRGQACKQKMGELPTERLDEVPAFTHVGVDFFGPYTIKQRRTTVKRYIVIYTCLVTRATHLDKAYGLSTDEFINSYRRFVSRRGAVATIRCDRGTNFVGAKEELERNLEDIFDDKVCNALKDSGCQFVKIKMNPPSASHMGGVWERPIGTAKRIINILLHEYGHMLDDDLTDTVIAETEAIMNGMPLTTVDTSGADSMKPLTPAMLLTMKPSVAPPPLHRFGKADVYSKQRWRRAQHVVDEFWKRWRHELIPKWQERKKWNLKTRNMMVGDIVLIMEKDTPRMTWPMAKVTEVYPGDDGLVRSVKIKTQKSEYLRPVHKLLMLVERRNTIVDVP